MQRVKDETLVAQEKKRDDAEAKGQKWEEDADIDSVPEEDPRDVAVRMGNLRQHSSSISSNRPVTSQELYELASEPMHPNHDPEKPKLPVLCLGLASISFGIYGLVSVATGSFAMIALLICVFLGLVFLVMLLCPRRFASTPERMRLPGFSSPGFFSV